MAEDYYKILDVPKTATQDDIQKAYLKLARKYHPDMNPDDQEGAKKKFQELQTAFDVLKDPEKRKQYDQFGENFSQFGSAGGQGFNGFQGGTFRWPPNGSGKNPFDNANPFGNGNINLDDLFGMFGGGAGQGADNPFSNFGSQTGSGRRRRRAPAPVQGENLTFSVEIPFKTAVQGGKISLNHPDTGGKMESLDIKIPAGIENGKKIRLRGQGNPGSHGGASGDLILEVKIQDHPFFSRKGNNLYVKVPITLKEAALGAKVDVPTPDGLIVVTVPPGSTTGTKLRLKGRGIGSKNGEATPEGKKGDLFIDFEVQLPKNWSKNDQELLEKIDSNLTPQVRSGLYF
ncbi:MAG: J domain-containing protein [Planctomycetia bacterium]|nr:J domain-containing protein [Planctomycetia bacterium]